MAHKKGGGSTRNGRDSKAKRLGVKVFGDAAVNVIVNATEGELDKEVYNS